MLQDTISKFKSSFDCYTELRRQVNSIYDMSLSTGGRWSENLCTQSGISARVFLNNAFGFCASSETDDHSIVRIINIAKRNARALWPYVTKRGSTLLDIPSHHISVNDEVKELDTKLLRQVAEEMMRYATVKYPNIQINISMWQSSSEKLLVVSNGCDGRSNVVLGNISVVIRNVSEGSEYLHGEANEAYDVYLSDIVEPKRMYALVDDAYDAFKKNLSETKAEKALVEGGEYDCVLSPEFTAMLAHEAVGHTCEADNVVAEYSVASVNMGKQVASTLVSLTDFAHTVYGQHCPIPLHIDDEGTPCVDAPIIRDGVLVGCMTNRALAERLAMPVTGNARASQYYDEPIVRMRNTCFHAGSSSLDDMISSIDHGYYLTHSSGGNGDLDGRFNMNVSAGYEIVHGKIGRPIRPTIAAGLAWEALKTVDMVSCNFVESKATGECGKKQSIPTGQGGPEMKLRLTLG